MSINLNVNLVAKVRQLLATALSKVTFTGIGAQYPYNSEYVALLKECDDLLLAQKNRSEELQAMLGSDPFSSFIQSKLFERFLLTKQDGAKAGSLLTSHPDFSDPKEAATGLMNQFLDLPNDYVASFPLQIAGGEHSTPFREILNTPLNSGSLSLTGSWLRRDDQSFPSVADESPVLTGLLAFAPKRQEVDTMFLQILARGYVSFLADAPVRKAYGEFKAFVGLAIATGLMSEKRLGLVEEHLADPGMSLSRRSEAGWITETTTHIAIPNAAFAKRLNFSNSASFAVKANELLRLFGTEDIGGNLKLAGRWIYDARANDKEPVMRFMQLAIAMEVLLQSDAGEESLTKGLAQKCAYLIGNSVSERSAIKDRFSELYRIRSKIVHNGVYSFSRKETLAEEELYMYCRRAIAAELQLALADIDLKRGALVAALRNRVRI